MSNNRTKKRDAKRKTVDALYDNIIRHNEAVVGRLTTMLAHHSPKPHAPIHIVESGRLRAPTVGRAVTARMATIRELAGLEDPEAKDADTCNAGLVKGSTACNRQACQRPLGDDRWWNSSTRSFYCRYCAARINHGAHPRVPCTPEKPSTERGES